MKRIVDVLVAGLLVAVALVLGSTAASAATESRISWSPEDVRGVGDGLAHGDLACDVGSLAFKGPYSVLGLLCGRGDPPLRAAVNEATVRKCGIDVYVTPGDRSYDTRFRYVVCP
jgi:hypothetical protein